MRLFFHYILKSYLFISLCAAGSVASGWLLLGEDLNQLPYYLPLLAFSATFILYNFSLLVLELVRGEGQRGRRYWFSQHRIRQFSLLLINGAILVYCCLQLTLLPLLYLLHLGLISGLYNLPASVMGQGYLSIRSLPLLKIFLIAYVWASVSVGLSWFYSSASLALGLGAFFSQYLFVVAITLPFDIRDYGQDKERQLLTVPQLLGIKSAKRLSVGLLTIFSVALILYFSQAVTALGLLLLGSWTLIKAHSRRNYWYYLALVDGLLLLQFILLFLSN